MGNLETAGEPRLSADVPTLAEWLVRAGFHTAGFTDGGNVTGSLGFERGFERFTDRHTPFDQRLGEVLAWLEDEAVDASRWFAFAHTYAVHDPYFSGARFRKRFVREGYQGDLIGDSKALAAVISAGDDRAPKVSPGRKLVANFWRRQDLDAPEDLTYLQELYLAGVAQADEQWGAFLKKFEQLEQAEETLLVATSDHGEEFGEHGRTRHDQLFEEILRVPLIVRVPGAEYAGSRIAAPVRHVDLVPSVLDLLGVSDGVSASFFQGQSWAEWLVDGAPAQPRPVYAEHRSLTRNDLDLWVLRQGDRSAHLSRAGLEAFDLALDGAEQRPLAAEPLWLGEFERVAAEQRAELDKRSKQFAPAAGPKNSSARARSELEALGYMEEQE